ncbi:hypothetical protein ACSBR2_026139 [Camellia fascicularis]
MKGRDYPWEMYSLKVLLHATNSFHIDNKIGEGGFGSVYWGRTIKEVASRGRCTSVWTVIAKWRLEVRVANDVIGGEGELAGGDCQVKVGGRGSQQWS